MSFSNATDTPLAQHPADGDAAARAAHEAAGGNLSTLNDDGSRRWINPRPSPGRFASARRITAYSLIAIFTVLPYLKMNGKPVILLDIAARRFTFFGKTFLPTDTVLLALLMVTVFLTVFLLTAVFGRVWCGWACPQTVYMEFLFRPIERFFEGTPGRVKKNRIAASGAGKILKYAVYLVLALFLAHTFLAYFVGVERLAVWVRRSPLEHPTSFLVMLATTGLMLFDFGFFREQMCIVACPYGRFQSVMLDRNSLVVSYDPTRGEPRGKARSRARREPAAASDGCEGCGGCGPACAGDKLKVQPASLSLTVLDPVPKPPRPVGDCVDCGLCVSTCPTGIDIRNGLQMECIHCAQCIDACDAVMTKLKRPTGLIRYTSQNAMAGRRANFLRPRVVVYLAILTVLLTAFTTVLLTAKPINVTVVRGLGRPFTELPGGDIANPVRIKVWNRTDEPAVVRIGSAAGAAVRVQAEQGEVMILPGESATVPAMLVAPAGAFVGGAPVGLVRVELTGPGTDDIVYSREISYRLVGPAASRSGPRTGTGDHR